MVSWVKGHQLPFFFLVSLLFGLILITAAAFTVSAGLGLLTAGVSSIGGGHWVTYLKVQRGSG
jgi:hypothetical protein